MSKKRVTLKEKSSTRGLEEAKVYPHTYKKRGVCPATIIIPLSDN
jgi:hypothetical protein